MVVLVASEESCGRHDFGWFFSLTAGFRRYWLVVIAVVRFIFPVGNFLLLCILTQALDGLMELFKGRVLSFDVDAARCYAELAVTARENGRGFLTPDGYIAAIAAARGFLVASRDTAPLLAAGVSVINPWEAPL